MTANGAATSDGSSIDGEIAVGDHLRPLGGGHPPCVYRVVGTTDRLALLRVTDGERREFTGELRHVDGEMAPDEFERAEDPDEHVDPVRAFSEVTDGLYWTVRGFLP